MQLTLALTLALASAMVSAAPSQQQKRAANTPSSTIYQYGGVPQGCYVDAAGSGGSRTLNDYTFSSSSMTNQFCANTCASLGYQYSGTGFGDQCWCNNNNPSPTLKASTSCNTKCSGNGFQTCGGDYALSVTRNFQVGDNAYIGTVSGGQYISIGCYSDSTSSRTYTEGYLASGSLSVESCATHCTDLGYGYSATEYGSQCFCGSSLPSSTFLSSSSCNMACSGAPTEVCGGSNALSVLRQVI